MKLSVSMMPLTLLADIGDQKGEGSFFRLWGHKNHLISVKKYYFFKNVIINWCFLLIESIII